MLSAQLQADELAAPPSPVPASPNTVASSSLQWPPDELAPLGGAPFALVMARLALKRGGTSLLKSKVLAMNAVSRLKKHGMSG